MSQGIYADTNTSVSIPLHPRPKSFIAELRENENLKHIESLQRFFDTVFKKSDLEDTQMNRCVVSVLYEGITGCRSLEEAIQIAESLYLPYLADKNLTTWEKSVYSCQRVREVRDVLFRFLKLPIREL